MAARLPRFKKIFEKNIKILPLLLVVILAVGLGLEINKNLALKKSLDNQTGQASSDNSDLQNKINDVNNQLSESKSNYDILKQAVLKDDSHAQEIGRRLAFGCDTSSKLYIKPPGKNLTPDQQKAICYKAVQDGFVDDYVQQNGNIQ